MSGVELLNDLLTDSYCHVCEAALSYASQRVSHYEGKKHGQKLKVFLQAKRAEMNKEATGFKWTLVTNKGRFCELCNMVFSSNVVTKSHYEGKVHLKNLRKQGLQEPDMHQEVCAQASFASKANTSGQILPPEDTKESSINPTSTLVPLYPEVDLKDSNKYCALCVASFNSPRMASQHYNGKRHQRNLTRQELLKDPKDSDEHAKSLMCHVQLSSIEPYQAHMKGNNHQNRKKKVIDPCRSQNVHSSFADELADYIQVQKARGITPKTNPVHSQGASQQVDEGEQVDDREQDCLSKGEVKEMMNDMFAHSVPPIPPQQSFPYYYPAEMWRSSHKDGSLPQHSWNYSFPPPVPQCTGFQEFTNWPSRRRKHSSSSSYATASSLSDLSASRITSDSEESEFRQRQKSKFKRSRRDKGTRKVDGCDEWEKKKKVDRRKTFQNEGKFKRKRNKLQKKLKVQRCEMTDKPMPEEMRNQKYSELCFQPEMNCRLSEGEPSVLVRDKYRRERKKTKVKADNRTEEEKLWDHSILGC
ncbi:zinc finger matrin-type protein 1 [Gouania willdenowi]|uniref:zinc finger matrin-type protein 1 n=1 Tax=Gouania willdenowi TaxID=441366 RepID=UPI001056973C|nr:zinc finger matrin-type protein 1-like [Gouania willdenowi]XP_028302947.1 zinc finger matrin-type protein 1-like [Gouania willdenowi]